MFGVWCLFWASFVLRAIDDTMRFITRSSLWMRVERFCENVRWEMELLWTRLNSDPDELDPFGRPGGDEKEPSSSSNKKPSWTTRIVIDLLTIIEETLIRGKVWEQPSEPPIPSPKSSRRSSRHSSIG